MFTKIEPICWLAEDWFAPVAAMTNLQSLTMESYQGSFPKTLSNLVQLRTLKLYKCMNIFSPLDVSKLTNLTKLDVSQTGIVEIVGLDQLTNLKQLIFGRIQVASYAIKEGRNNFVVPDFPSGINKLDNLLELTISGFKELKHLPTDLFSTSFETTVNGLTVTKNSSLRKLERLTVKDMPNLASLPENVSQLSSLRYLYLCDIGSAYCDIFLAARLLKSNSTMKSHIFFELPEQIGGLSSLETFWFSQHQSPSGCGITKLPKSFGKLKQLKE